MQRKPVIIIAILSVISLGLGYWVGLPKGVSGGDGNQTSDSKEPDSLKKGLVAYYPFNGDAKDKSGNGNHGEVTGAKFIDDIDRPGEKRSACYFDGRFDFIEIQHSDSLSFSSPNYTIAIWVKCPSQGIYAALFIKAQEVEPFTGPTVFVSYSTIGTVAFREVSSAELHSKQTILDQNRWSHLAFVKVGEKMSIFIDGLLDSSIERDNGNARINNQPIVLGANNRSRADQNYKGWMDDLRIYNRALSAEEVKILYEFEKMK